MHFYSLSLHWRIRDLNAVSAVSDEAGKPKGLLLTFGNLTSFAGKKHRDPAENRHNVVFVNWEGNLKFSYGFEHGDPDNGRGFYPMLTVEKDGQLRILSTNYEKLLKPYLETVVLSDKGKVSAARSEQPLELNGVALNGLTNGRTDRVRTYHANNLTFVVKQGATTGLSKTSAQVETTYDNVQIMAFKPDFTGVAAVSVPAGSKSVPTQVDLIGEANETPRLVLTSPVGNHIVTLNEQLPKVNVTPKDGRVPTSPLMNRNFAYDPTGQKAYFMYETPKAGEGKLIAVSMEQALTNR